MREEEEEGKREAQRHTQKQEWSRQNARILMRAVTVPSESLWVNTRVMTWSLGRDPADDEKDSRKVFFLSSRELWAQNFILLGLICSDRYKTGGCGLWLQSTLQNPTL